MENFERFNVFVRVRPTLSTEVENKYILDEDKREAVQVSDSNKEITLYKDDDDPRRFVFDHVITKNINQIVTYKYAAENIVNSVLEGYNGTVMAYGQTGSGKTYTIFGPKRSLNVNDEDFVINKESGIVFRSLNHVFEYIQANNYQKQFRVSLSFFQIYLENIQDLLSPDYIKDNLAVREDPKNGVYIEGLTLKPVKSLFEVLNYIKEGVKSRITSTTAMNKCSSRSHAVLQLTIEQRWIEDANDSFDDEPFKKRSGRSLSPGPPSQKAKKKHIKKSILSLVDLAGSERLSKSNSEGLRCEEAKSINKSIATLGNCIAALANQASNEKKKGIFNSIHIPFRDTKLTRVLSDCLGGNAKTSICACVAPTTLNSEESFSTLLFASRAMTVKINPKLNENIFVKGQDNSLMTTTVDERSIIETKKLKEEVEFLRTQLFQRDVSPAISRKSPSNRSLILPDSVMGSNNNSVLQNSRIYDPNNKNSEPYDYDGARSARGSRKYERPFMFTSYSKENNTPDSERGYSKKEQAIVRRYAGLIESLQAELIKKEVYINELEGKLENFTNTNGNGKFSIF